MPNNLFEVIFPSSSKEDRLNTRYIDGDDLIRHLQNQSDINTVLTTDSETFLINKKNYIEAVLPFENLKQRLNDSAQKNKPDLIILSHCFFNSGMAIKHFSSFIEELSALSKFIIIDFRQSYLYLRIEMSFRFQNIYFIIQDISNDSFQPFDPINLSNPPYYQETRERIHQIRSELVLWDHFYFCEKNIISVDYDYHGPFVSFAMPSAEHAQKYRLELESRNKIVSNYLSRLIVDLRKN